MQLDLNQSFRKKLKNITSEDIKDEIERFFTDIEQNMDFYREKFGFFDEEGEYAMDNEMLIVYYLIMNKLTNTVKKVILTLSKSGHNADSIEFNEAILQFGLVCIDTQHLMREFAIAQRMSEDDTMEYV